MALALLAHEAGYDVRAFTVDHGLRPDSAEEAQRVHSWLSGRGLSHRVLRVDWRTMGGPPSGSGIQEAARLRRYAALVAAAEATECATLLIGQHADDQAETLLLRLGMGSTVDGLAGIRPAVAVPVDVGRPTAVRVVRPLLPHTKAELEEWLRERSVQWVLDPSNAKPMYKRNRVRLALAALPTDLRPALGALQAWCAAHAEHAYAHGSRGTL